MPKFGDAEVRGRLVARRLVGLGHLLCLRYLGRPRARRRTRQPPSAMAAFCSTSATGVPWALIAVMSPIWSMSFGASPRDGSSRRRTLGSAISARLIASICCSPPESRPARWLAGSARRGQRSVTRSRAAPRPRGGVVVAPTLRFSSTVMRPKVCRPSGDYITPALVADAGDRLCSGRPSVRRHWR